MRKMKRSYSPSSSSSRSSSSSSYSYSSMHEYDRERSKNLNRLRRIQTSLNQSLFDEHEDAWSRTSDAYVENANGVFEVHFKGLMNDDETVKESFGGIGVVIYDSRDRCVFELRKPVMVRCDGGRKEAGYMMELKALHEALVAAVTLDLKRARILCDSHSVIQYLARIRRPSNNKIATLVDELNLARRKLSYRGPFYLRQNDVSSVYKLARDAIATQSIKFAKTASEQCRICLEYVFSDQMFSVNKCLHRFCFSCMRKHVKSRLLEGLLPECPHDECEYKLDIKSCKTFLNQKLYDIFNLRMEEASIPPRERVYCPLSQCSALMSKTEVKIFTASNSSSYTRGIGMRKCVKCRHRFCVDCKVPWHYKVSCTRYKKSLAYKSSNEARVKSLATRNGWRECIKCKNIVELFAGCFHIKCRCGYEFCYTCGAGFIKKKPTCRCPAWAERLIVDDVMAL